MATLESVVSQTKKPTEIIVSDNGSIDDTLELVRRFQLENSCMNITLTSCAKPGAGPNRNHAVGASIGEILAFLDADDIWESNFLYELTDESIPANYIRGAYARYINSSGRILGQSNRSKDDDSARIEMMTAGTMPFLLSSWVMNRDTFVKLIGFDEAYVLAQDFEFLHRHLVAGGRIQVRRKILMSYTLHSQSETTLSHHLQRLTCRFILDHDKNQKMTIHEYLQANSRNLSSRLKSKSDIYIREFVFNQTSARVSRLDLLILAFCFSPIRFIRKIIRQRPNRIGDFK